MQEKKLFIIVGLIFLIFAFSCVTTKNFKEMEDKKNQLNGERNELFAENEQLTVDNAEMQAKIESMESDMEEIETWKAEVQEDYDKLKVMYENGLKMNIPDMRLVDRQWIDENEPFLDENLQWALLGASACVINPYEATYALAENAVDDRGRHKECGSSSKNPHENGLMRDRQAHRDPLFSAASRTAGGANDRAVNAPQLLVDVADV